MQCPGCGAELAESAKSCGKCGRPMLAKKSGGFTPGVVKIIIAVLVVVLLGGAGFAVLAQNTGQDTGDQRFNPRPGQEWVHMDFDFAGMRFDVPGDGWRMTYDASSRMIFENNTGAKLDIYFVSMITLNPDIHRIDNKPQVYQVVDQNEIQVRGYNQSIMYTAAQGHEDGQLVLKRQLFFRRTFRARNGQPQTFAYLVTLTYPSEYDQHYQPIFQHLVDTAELYEF